MINGNDDRTHLKEKLKRIVREHVGPEGSISMQALYVQLTGHGIIPYKRHEQTRIVRSLVNELRNEGCPIGSTSGNSSGYFWARDEKELGITIAKLHGQAMTSLKTEAALKRIPFSDLLKQYQIEFGNQPA
jgi:hypothetical protein